MRKYVRNILRSKAERMRVKASRYVGSEFNDMQVEKYGAVYRKVNQARGTHKRITWKQRINLYV